MDGDGCSAEPLAEHHRAAFREACAEDRAVWPIYATDFGPDGFGASIAVDVANPRHRVFVLFDRDELAGRSHVRDTALISILRDEWSPARLAA